MVNAVGIQLILFGFGWLLAAFLLPQERRCLLYWSAYAFLQGISGLLTSLDMDAGHLPGAASLMLGVVGYAAALRGVEVYATGGPGLERWMGGVLVLATPAAVLGQWLLTDDRDIKAALLMTYGGASTLIAAVATPRLWRQLRKLHGRAVSALALMPSTLTGLQGLLGLLLAALHIDVGSHRAQVTDAAMIISLLTTGTFNLCYAFLVTSRVVQRLRDATRLDHLTGLLSRAETEARMRSTLELLARKGGGCCVAMIDVDHFKRLNDEYGHAHGDQCLVLVARTLQRELRSYDILGRWGGDEFALVMPETSLEEAQRVLNRLVTAVREAGVGQGKALLSLSIGAVQVINVPPREAAETVLAQADQALYRAKAAGRGRVEMEPAAA